MPFLENMALHFPLLPNTHDHQPARDMNFIEVKHDFKANKIIVINRAEVQRVEATHLFIAKSLHRKVLAHTKRHEQTNRTARHIMQAMGMDDTKSLIPYSEHTASSLHKVHLEGPPLATHRLWHPCTHFLHKSKSPI